MLMFLSSADQGYDLRVFSRYSADVTRDDDLRRVAATDFVTLTIRGLGA
jgi:hypothetical protein